MKEPIRIAIDQDYLFFLDQARKQHKAKRETIPTAATIASSVMRYPLLLTLAKLCVFARGLGSSITSNPQFRINC